MLNLTPRPIAFSFASPVRRSAVRSRRGAMLVLILIMLIGFLATVAFSVDVAYMFLSRAELRSATDAAAKAAAVELSLTLDTESAIRRGQEIASLNTVGGDGLLLAPQDFDFGRSVEQTSGRFEYSTGGFPQNSVRVDGRRTSDSLSGPVPLFFGSIWGINSFEPEVVSVATYVERDITLVVDRSGSMRGQRFIDLVAAIDIFIDELNDTAVEEHVGLASYNDQGTADVQLTTNLTAITGGLRALQVGGFTSISRGMDSGETIVSGGRDGNFVERTLIVMTDGRHNRGPEPATVARRLAADGVTIFTITFGADADQARMAEVAQIGQGEHFHADDGVDLAEAYREIARTLSTVLTE